MTDNRRRNGRLLVIAAIAIMLLAVVLWGKAEQDADKDQLAADYTEALGGAADEVKADHTGSFALAGLGAVLFLSGVILVSQAPPEG